MSTTIYEISPGVKIIHRVLSATDQELKCENTTDSTVAICVDLSGSRGVSILDHSTLQTTVEVPAHKALLLVSLLTEAVFEQYQRLSIDSSYEAEEEEEDKSSPLLNNIKLFKDFYRSNNLYTRVSPETLPESKDYFIDPYFPPTNSSIFDGSDQSELQSSIIWKRPAEIFNGSYSLFDSIEPADIYQGRLGNCWFMCTLSSIAERPELVKKLFITNEVQPHGIYKIQLFKGGEWLEVTIDDFIPCEPESGPIFSRSHGNELWVLLLEKAYAKLHGSYMLLRNGCEFHAMMDLTGCPTGWFSLENQKTQEMIQSGELWTFLKNIDDEGGLISANTPGEDHFTESGGPNTQSGLVPGHAYTVLQVKEVHGQKLMNIRNPWGCFEWDGDWSDKSPLWTEEIIDTLKPVFSENDGNFWMSWDYVLKRFTGFCYCRLGNFNEVSKKGVFQKINICGEDLVLSNETYTLKCEEDTKVFITIHQDDTRILGASSRRNYIDLGLAVLEDEEDAYKIVKYLPQNNVRQSEVELDLEAGRKYVIVPLTTGCNLCRESNSDSPIQLMRDDEFDPLFESTLKDIFRKANSKVGEGLSYSEFQALMSEVKVTVTEDEFEQLKREVPSIEEGITKEGFVEYIRDLLAEQGEEKIREWLTTWGYDEYLYSVKSRVFVVSFHSYAPINVESVFSDPENDMSIETWGMLLDSYGTLLDETDGVATYSLLHSDYGGVTFLAINNSDTEFAFICDYSESVGLIFSCGKSRVSRTLQPGEVGSIIHYALDKFASEVITTYNSSVKNK